MAKLIDKKYTDPKISKSGKKCFVWFRFYDDVSFKWKLIIKKGGVNYSDLPPRERTAQLNALRKAILFKLEIQGWNPLTNSYTEISEEELLLEKIKSIGFNEAIDFAMSKLNVSTKTRSCYSGTAKFIKKAAVAINFDKKPVSSIERIHIKSLLEKCRKEHSLSNNAYNKHLGYLKAIMGQLIEWDVIQFNPASKIKTMPVAETHMYVTITEPERKIIQEYLCKHHYHFFVYLMVIYYTGIRPKEVTALQIKDLDFEKSLITILPDIFRENSKTRKIRRVPLNPHLIKLLQTLELEKFRHDDFIFGSPHSSGIGNRGAIGSRGLGVNNPDYFKPSSVMIKRDTVTKFWNATIRTKLGIKKYMYALKHTGADDMILAGINIDALKELYGHSSKLMTEKYTSRLKEIYRKEIVENSPAFIKV